LHNNGKIATIEEGEICSVFINKTIHFIPTHSTTIYHHFNFLPKFINGASYLVGFFVDRTKVNSDMPGIDKFYSDYIGYHKNSLSFGYNDYGYKWNQGVAEYVNPETSNAYFTKDSLIKLTIIVSGNEVSSCCTSNGVSARTEPFELVEGDVIYIGATLRKSPDSISILNGSITTVVRN
jgi:hypothetical protein